MKRKKEAQWSRLDNAAKIFPPTSNKLDTKVFRFACELYEPVDSEILQQALNINIELFPMFTCVLKRGLFWYYLETSILKPKVKQENKVPCSQLYDRNARTLLFDVTYFNKRINFEVYHALTDGTGALQFLRVLVYNYLIIKYPLKFKNNPPNMDYDVSESQKKDDSFLKYYNNNYKKNSKKTKIKTAYKLKGIYSSEHRLKIIEGIMPVNQVLNMAHEHNVSVTVFLSALFIQAIYENMSVRDRKKPVILSIPVNLRNFFHSNSERNFFSVVNVKYDFYNNPPDFESVIKCIDQQFKDELKTEKLEEKIGRLLSLEHNIIARAVPLVLKDIILKTANKLEDKKTTVSLSNVGKVNMPSEFKEYIRLFDVFVSTNKLQICMCSFENNMTVSFTSSLASTEIQKIFFRMLSNKNIDIEIVSN